MLNRILTFAFLTLPLLAGLPPGRPLPDAFVQLPGGQKLPLKQLRGKPALLAILSTTCRECTDMVTLLKKLQKEYEPRGLQIEGIVVQEMAEKLVPLYVQDQKPTFPFGYMDLPGYQKLVNLRAGEGARLPILVFVDHKAMVRVVLFGTDPLLKQPELIIRSTVRELLNEQQSSR